MGSKIAMILFIFTCAYAAHAQVAVDTPKATIITPQEAANTITPLDTRYIELCFPKGGFIGSPYAEVYQLDALAHIIPRYPDDFEKHYLQIHVLGKSAIDNGIRVTMDIAEIDPAGKMIHPNLYLAYLDIHPDSVRIFSKIDNDGQACDSDTTIYMIPFPLTYTRPLPLVNALGHHGVLMGKGESPCDGIVDLEWGALYLPPQVETKNGVTLTTIHVTMLRIYLKERLTITGAEIQAWEGNDWLWKSMERTDRNGHTLLRCRQVTLPLQPDAPPK